jgi:hypothetical protein
VEKKQHKVIILGDSHTRGCAAKVKHLLNNDFEVLRFVNPGSGMKFIKDTARVKLQELTKKDVVVLLGDSNDIARNNSIAGMKHLLEFVINANHTNVILMSTPHRCDLIRNSCDTNEVEVFNSKLCKRLQRFGKVEMTDVVSERNFYTKHGQHLNSEGKESMAKKTATIVECLLNRKVEPVIGKWYTEEKTDNQEHQAMQGKIDNNPEDEKSECSSTSGVLDTLKVQDAEQKCECKNILDIVNKKSPKRPRRQPVTRNIDFLWTDISKN